MFETIFFQEKPRFLTIFISFRMPSAVCINDVSLTLWTLQLRLRRVTSRVADEPRDALQYDDRIL